MNVKLLMTRSLNSIEKGPSRARRYVTPTSKAASGSGSRIRSPSLYYLAEPVATLGSVSLQVTMVPYTLHCQWQLNFPICISCINNTGRRERRCELRYHFRSCRAITFTVVFCCHTMRHVSVSSGSTWGNARTSRRSTGSTLRQFLH